MLFKNLFIVIKLKINIYPRTKLRNTIYESVLLYTIRLAKYIFKNKSRKNALKNPFISLL